MSFDWLLAESTLPASFPGTGSWAQTESRIELDWLAESLVGDLGCLIRFRKRSTMPFFFDLFAAVDESWSAMNGDESVVTRRGKMRGNASVHHRAQIPGTTSTGRESIITLQ